MRALVDRHMNAEGQGDIDGAVAVYTDDVEHVVVGFPNSPSRGENGARDFYTYLTTNFRTESRTMLHRHLADDAMILEQLMTGTVVGSLLGLPGNGPRISVRILQIFEVPDELISRENFRLDSAAIVEQLS